MSTARSESSDVVASDKDVKWRPLTKVYVAFAIAFYAAAISSHAWVGQGLPSDAVFFALLGAAIGFQTKVISERQARRGVFAAEPNHLAVFLIIVFGGAALFVGAVGWPDLLGANLMVIVAASYLVSPALDFWSSEPQNLLEGPNYRAARDKARMAGLHVFFIVSAIAVLADNFGLVHAPLWFVVALCVWAVVSVMTGRMWLLRRR